MTNYLVYDVLTLAIRFKVELKRYDQFLNNLSLPQLEELLRVALQVQEVVEFVAVLDDMINDSNNSVASKIE